MIKGSSTGGNSVGLKGGGRKRGILFLVSVLLIVQLITWRGTSKLKAVSLSKRSEYETRLNKRQFIDDTNHYNQSEIDWENGDSLMNKHKKDKKKSDKKHEKDDKKSNKKHEKKGKDDKDHSSSSSTKAASQTSTFTSTSSESSTRTSMIECQPLPTHAPAQDVCEHVRQYCPPTGHLNYLEFFFCIGLSESSDIQTAKAQITAAPSPTPQPSENDEEKDTYTKTETEGLDIRLKWLRAIALTCIIGWMLFLFSWVGIVASDFFCPNLSNLAARLGLSESTAGVTFLAFGNGSPDVFSTFGAMRSGSGSLAIGELIGAASFIVSVISGSMMLIAPFKVKPYPFIRDVGFFTVAVSLTMAYLIDGKLRFAECLSMIALYVAYAATIIIGSWWQERRSKNRARMASIRSENSFVHHSSEGGFREEIGRQTPSTQPHRSPRLVSAIEYEPDVDPFVQWATQQDTIANGGGHLTPPSVVSAGHSPLLQPTDLPTGSSGASTTNPRLLRFRAGVLARHSLLGAVEFRDVVRSLRQESGGGGVDHSMEIYQSRDPERYLPHPHSQSQIQILNLDQDQRRSHKRAKSLTKPRISGTNGDFQASMVRSRSTIGSSADHGPMTDIVRPTLEQVGQQAGLAAVAAAVGDPWKEHGPADGCDDPGLPLSSGMPTTSDLERGNGDVDHRSRPTLPRLAIRQATGSSRNTRLMRMDTNQTTSSYQSPFTSKDAFIRAIQRTRRALFPSLRHFREKSWLGIVVGLLTAPAILLLKLTLPVVDDEEEQSVITGEKRVRNGTTATNSNQIRLAGDESPLLARQPSYTARSLPTNPQYEDEEDEEEDDEDVEERGRGIINLNSENIENPWDVSRAQSEENEEESNAESNRKRQLHVSSILRNLPEESSPLLFTSPRNMNTSSRSLNESEQSWESDDSHSVSSSQSLFLTVAQCLFAPPFCVWAISSSAESEDVEINTILAFGCGLGFATMVFIMVMHIRHTGTQHRVSPAIITLLAWIRVAVGFFVSILYIMTIVDEVVSILQTLGLILGLSDAILGLTVFAMGNSLGDLVANITIAKMGHPVMAISACFAGPLLNLLLGIGISGSWLLSKGAQTIPEHPNQDLSMILFKKHHHHVNEEPGIYHIDFSPTLTVSGFGLLLILIGTLILVPLNGFYLDRRIGSTLIITYIIIMFVNIGVELYTLHRNV